MKYIGYILDKNVWFEFDKFLDIIRYNNENIGIGNIMIER